MGTLKKSWNSFELETRFTKNSYHGSTREFFSRYDSRSASGYRYEGRKKKKEKNGEEILFVKTICKYTVQTNIEFLFILMEVFIYIYIYIFLFSDELKIYLSFLFIRVVKIYFKRRTNPPPRFIYYVCHRFHGIRNFIPRKSYRRVV